jgi:hypothetical protein
MLLASVTCLDDKKKCVNIRDKYLQKRSQDSSVGIATGYGLDE